MIKFKINGKWLEADKIAIFRNKESYGLYEASRIEDVQMDYYKTYADLQDQQLVFLQDENSPASEEDVNAMNDYDAVIAPLADRVSQIEDILRNIILALDIDKQTIIDEQGNDRGQHYVSVKLADLTKSVERLDERTSNMFLEHAERELNNAAKEHIAYYSQYTNEHKPQSTVQEAPICEQQIDWEQRRYEIAKHVAGAIYAHSTDVPDVEANYIIELTDNVIKQLKSNDYGTTSR
jgi:hypothetical protein